MTPYDVHDGTDALIFRDHLLERDRWTEEALRRFVLERPESDPLRLLYALWCRENGQEERGEFIRVQVELPGIPLCGGGDVIAAGHCPGCDRVLELRRRERELLENCRDEWLRDLVRVFGHNCPVEASSTIGWNCEFTRGFVSSVELSTAAFLDHAKAIFSAQPVVEVRLVDKECHICWYFSVGDENGEAHPNWLPWILKGAPWKRAASRQATAREGAYRVQFKENEDAHADLSDACVWWGRTQAGLPPVETAHE